MQPASSSRLASSITRKASSAVLPAGLNPPILEMDCGVSPTCPTTPIPASEIARIVSARAGKPPSTLTASTPPSLSILTDESIAWAVDASKHPNGRSPTMNGLDAPRVTALQKEIISSRVTGSVVSWPCTTIPALSPTRTMSTPASSACAALG